MLPTGTSEPVSRPISPVSSPFVSHYRKVVLSAFPSYEAAVSHDRYQQQPLPAPPPAAVAVAAPTPAQPQSTAPQHLSRSTPARVDQKYGADAMNGIEQTHVVLQLKDKLTSKEFELLDLQSKNCECSRFCCISLIRMF
jgi:hypothetical protein